MEPADLQLEVESRQCSRCGSEIWEGRSFWSREIQDLPGSNPTCFGVSSKFSATKQRPCLDAVKVKHKIFINRLHGVLNVVEK